MEFAVENLLLYGITDRTWTGEKTLAQQVEQALLGGVTMIQFREKHLLGEELYKEAVSVQKVCHAYNVPFIIDDDVSLAKEIDADGVHLGQKDMDAKRARQYLGSNKIIGVSARTVEQAREAKKNGADYLGVGAMFSTGTKNDAVVIDHNIVWEIKNASGLPVVGIGGIKLENIEGLSGIGLDGIAVISGIFAQPDVKEAAKELKKAVRKCIKHENITKDCKE